MERINVIDVQVVCDIAVIAQLGGRRHLGAATEHGCHVTGSTEPPVARVNGIEFARQDVPIPRED
jgi:hypothetical protein